MAVINPFPKDTIRDFVARTNPSSRYLFALLNAQRAVVIADDATGGFTETDRSIFSQALESCWSTAESPAPTSNLHEYIDTLSARLVPDDDDDYTPYNSALNSALAGLVYAIESYRGADAAESAFHAASSMFDLADYLLQRNNHGNSYVEDLASAPITALAARIVSDDIEDLERGETGLEALRQRATNEGHWIASLAR